VVERKVTDTVTWFEFIFNVFFTIFETGNVLQAFLTIDHTLTAQGYHVVDEVQSCAEEVAEYLSDLSNWQRPIFPDEAGCSRLEVLPQYFNMSGTLWNCDRQLSKSISYGKYSHIRSFY